MELSIIIIILVVCNFLLVILLFVQTLWHRRDERSRLGEKRVWANERETLVGIIDSSNTERDTLHERRYDETKTTQKENLEAMRDSTDAVRSLRKELHETRDDMKEFFKTALNELRMLGESIDFLKFKK